MFNVYLTIATLMAICVLNYKAASKNIKNIQGFEEDMVQLNEDIKTGKVYELEVSLKGQLTIAKFSKKLHAWLFAILTFNFILILFYL